MKFITGEAAPNDSNWAAYIAKLENLGLRDCIGVYQNAYGEYLSGNRFIASTSSSGPPQGGGGPPQSSDGQPLDSQDQPEGNEEQPQINGSQALTSGNQPQSSEGSSQGGNRPEA